MVVVDDEVGFGAGVGVVVEAAVADGAHADRLGAGDVGAAQVADVDGLGGGGSEGREGGFEDLGRGLVVADLVGEAQPEKWVSRPSPSRISRSSRRR